MNEAWNWAKGITTVNPAIEHSFENSTLTTVTNSSVPVPKASHSVDLRAAKLASTPDQHLLDADTQIMFDWKGPISDGQYAVEIVEHWEIEIPKFFSTFIGEDLEFTIDFVLVTGLSLIHI